MTTSTPQTPKETPIQRHAREMREARAQHEAELHADPQQKAMAEALKLTKVEREDLAKAEAKVSEAEAAVGRIVGQINALKTGRVTEQTFMRSDGRPLIKRLLDPKVQAKEAAELPELKLDLEAARGVLQSAQSRRHHVLQALNAAKMRRRKAAKAKHSPPPPMVKSRGDWWSSMERLGRKDAA